jgi:hypothetical protein
MKYFYLHVGLSLSAKHFIPPLAPLLIVERKYYGWWDAGEVT